VLTVGLTDVLSVVGVMLPVAQYLLMKSKQQKLRGQLAVLIQNTVEEMTDAAYTLIEITMTIFGAHWLGSMVCLPDERATMMRERYQAEYDRFISSCQRLYQITDDYNAEFMKAFGDEWLEMKAIMHVFKSEKPDWTQFLTNPLFEKPFQRAMKQNTFIDALNHEMNCLTDDVGLKTNELQNIVTLITDKNYRKCIIRCMHKRNNPQTRFTNRHR